MHVVTCLTSCDVADSELEGVKDEKAHKIITTKSRVLGPVRVISHART